MGTTPSCPQSLRLAQPGASRVSSPAGVENGSVFRNSPSIVLLPSRGRTRPEALAAPCATDHADAAFSTPRSCSAVGRATASCSTTVATAVEETVSRALRAAAATHGPVSPFSLRGTAGACCSTCHAGYVSPLDGPRGEGHRFSAVLGVLSSAAPLQIAGVISGRDAFLAGLVHPWLSCYRVPVRAA